MDPITLPENLSALGGPEITLLADQIASRMRVLGGQKPYTPDTVKELQSLRGMLDQVNTRAAEIRDENTRLEAEAAEALQALGTPAETPAEGDPAEGQAPPVPGDTPAVEPVAVVPVDAAAVPPAAPTGPNGQVPVPVPVAAAAETVTPDPEPAPAAPAVPAAPQVVPVTQRDAIAELRAMQATGRAPAPPAPRPENTRRQFGLVAAQAIHLPGPGSQSIPNAQPFESEAHFAEVVTALRDRMGRSTMSGRSMEYVGHAELFPDDKPRLGGDAIQNYGIFDQATNPSKLNDTLVASGTLCAPDNPIYDFFRLAVPQAPVEAYLPVVPAPRGGIRYIQTPDFRAARAAIGTRTKAQNADPATADKPCSRAVCPTIAEAYVTAVSECVRWDNLTFRAFPELVQNYMTDVAVNFASVKECLYLTAIDAVSTAVTAAVPAYGAARSFFFQLSAASAGYRKRQNMLKDSQLIYMLPNWVPSMLQADIVNDPALGMNHLDNSLALVNSIFANLNVTPVWYNDQANCSANWVGDTQAWRQAQAAGALNLFPATAVGYLHAPGEFVRLDSGSLDVGLVRDSTLNGTNDLELFMESWVGVVHMGLEAVKITHTLCANGTAPQAVAAMACA